MGKKSLHPNIYIGAFLIILSIFFYHMASEFVNSAAALWPKGILVCIIALSSFLIFNGIHLTTKANDSQNTDFKKTLAPIISIIAIAIYAALMNVVGFFIATAIFCPFGMFALGQRNRKVIIGVTIGLDIFVYILFVTQLQLQMP